MKRRTREDGLEDCIMLGERWRTVIGVVALHETPAIYIDHLTPCAIITAEHVKAAYSLAESFAYLSRP